MRDALGSEYGTAYSAVFRSFTTACVKMLLSIREAAEYSNIGINKIDEMLKQPNCPFVLYVGTKKLVKRKAFEDFIESRVAI